MASKKQSKEQIPANLPPDLLVGTRVSIMRPHLWSGCYGEVVKVSDAKHTIKIFGKDGASFHTEAYATHLIQENCLWPEIEIL